MERINNLKSLRVFLSENIENFNKAVELENYFLGDSVGSGCRCKFNSVKSRLNQFWESTGKNELETYEQNETQ